MIKKLEIAGLSRQERQEIVEALSEAFKDIKLSEHYKDIVIEAMKFFDALLEQLKESKINIHQLKQLLGFHSESLKKKLETH